MSKVGITLITMGQGNVVVLKETLESFKGIVDEVVYGDLLLFEEDRALLESYKEKYNINVQKLPFNYIFQMGFANCLNFLASNAKNEMVMYMNTSEVIDEDYGINDIIKNNPDCNSFYFTHKTDPHRWHRTYNKKELAWSGVIHEELRPLTADIKPYHKPIFMMKDLEKDMSSSFKASVFNTVKELTYFNNYLKLVDVPKEKGATNEGWVKFVADQYEDMKLRMTSKGERYEAFLKGDLDMFLDSVLMSEEFKKEKFESSDIINFQGNRKAIL